MNEIIINKIQNSDFNEVADILVDAFLTNPAYSLIFKEKNRREEGLLWLFKTNLFIINEKQDKYYNYNMKLDIIK